MLQILYRGLTALAGPAVRLWLARRRAAGKEDASRRGERLGRPSLPRPAGSLVWVHAASVGESLSVLALIGRLLERSPELNVLMTTGTVTSAGLMAQRLPDRAIHQYVPVDLPGAVTAFLDHWRPDVVLWMESELWPNLLGALRARGVPAALVNARLSARSFRRWGWAPGLVADLLSTFRLVLAQSEADATRLHARGAGHALSIGNLKYAAEPPPAPAAALEALRTAVAGRPVWLFASTHPGEDALAADAHRALSRQFPALLTIVAPRHPHRGGEVAAAASAAGLPAARRSDGAVPDAGTAVYVADTIGELGVFYRLAPVVCMGGSFIPHGGQNPLEPAMLGCAVLYGPHMHNFAEVVGQLEAAGASRPVPAAGALAATVAGLLDDDGARTRLADAGRRVTAENARALDRALAALDPLLRDAGVLRS